ncbi:MAG TPA: glycosyltransferase [Candidatus Acidoferrales bacterium]|nr:glycosyltransferase [Candidatus Acidoferrales bacterium]
MKIVHVVHSLEIGGLENGVVNLVNRLDPQVFKHVICCLSRSGKLAARIPQDVKIVELNLPTQQFRLPLIALARVFRRLRPDLVHTRGWGTIDAVFAAKLARIPLVVHGEHGRDWKDVSGSAWKRNRVRWLAGRIIDRYVVVCRFFRDWLQAACRIKADKIVCIPNGVDTARFFPVGQDGTIGANGAAGPGAETRGSLREKIGLPREGTLFGSVGRLDPVKDFPTLLRGFAEIEKRFPETRLAIAGDGPLRGELARLTRSLNLEGRVFWLGERQDVPAILRCLDVFVQASLFEGMSNTILEAMATGLPIVATDTGGNGELVADKENGWLVPVGRPSALARAMESYLADPKLRSHHGARSRARALEEFALPVMAERYAGLYQRLWGEKSRRTFMEN